MVRFLVLFSYIGRGYSGLQVQTDRPVKTIVGVLQDVFKALNKSVLTNPESFTEEQSKNNKIKSKIKQTLNIHSQIENSSNNTNKLSHPSTINKLSPFKPLEAELNPTYTFQSLFYPPDQIRLITSSRTDKDVSALCNAGHLDLHHPIYEEVNECLMVLECNRMLKHLQEDISLLQMIRVSDDFHSRFQALSRSYVYRLCVLNHKGGAHEQVHHLQVLPLWERCNCMCVRRELNMERMNEAADVMSGTHDFRGFTTPTKRLQMQMQKDKVNNNIRRLQVKILPGDGYLGSHMGGAWRWWEVHFKASSFLYKQVRRMVGMLVSVGRGDHTIDDVRQLLSPAHNYSLNQSGFPDISYLVKELAWKDNSSDQLNSHDNDDEDGRNDDDDDDVTRLHSNLKLKILQRRIREMVPQNASYETFQLKFKVPGHGLCLTKVEYPVEIFKRKLP